MAISTSTAPIAASAGAARAGFAPLHTTRLVLRPYEPADAVSLHRLINDWEITRNLSGVPYPYGRDKAEAWIAASLEQFATGTAWHLAVTQREDGRLIGGVGIRLDPGSTVGLLGYWLGRKSWGQGFATEAAGRLARWALANLELERLRSVVAVDNPRSAAVLQRLGFSAAGQGRETFEARGEACAVDRFELTRDRLPFDQPAPAAMLPVAGGKPMLLVAACALIDIDGRVLLTRRPEGKQLAGLWEFPGGKLEPHETPEQAVIRELREELDIDVEQACLAPFAFASHGYEAFHLLMPLYLCRRWQGLPRGAEGQTLAWVRPDRLAEYPMPAADRPLIPLLRAFL